MKRSASNSVKKNTSHTHTLAHGESNVHTHIHSLTHLKFRYSIVHPNERVNMKCSLQCFYCYRRYSFALGQISFYNSALLFLFTTNICIRRIVHDELNIPKIKIAVKSTTTCVCVWNRQLKKLTGTATNNLSSISWGLQALLVHLEAFFSRSYRTDLFVRNL